MAISEFLFRAEPARAPALARDRARLSAGPGCSELFCDAETTARYHQPAHFSDTLLVRTAREVRNRSFSLAFQIIHEGTGELIAEGSSVQVWLDESRRPAPIPPEPRARLEASLGGETSLAGEVGGG